MIPKTIHFIWIGDDMPEAFVQNVAAFESLNPDYNVVVHGEDVLLPELTDAYSTCERLDSKSDLLRLSALARYGGWYFDTDFYPIRPLDDCVRAFGIEGDRLFLAEQQHHRSSHLPISNAVLACKKDSAQIKRIVSDAIESDFDGRTSYGPQLLTDAVKARPLDFDVSPACWWYPLGRADAQTWWLWAMQGNVNSVSLKNVCHGQLPFAVHLWAGGQAIDLPRENNGKVACILWDPKKATRPLEELPIYAVVNGLAKMGYAIEYHGPKRTDDVSLPERCPDVAVAWNGRRQPIKTVIESMESAGVNVLRIEHGWFDRGVYSHIDNQGILHWASWASSLSEPASQEAFDRLALTHGDVVPPKARTSGYVLCLGQVTYDTQLEASDFNCGKHFEKACHIACEKLGLEAEFRPHPKAMGMYKRRSKWMTQNTAKSLEEAVAGARFVIAINSNSCNEALAMGCPALTIGPSLSGMSGLTIDCGKDGLEESIKTMLDGYCPDADETKNFLAQLAAHQFSLEEFRDGRPLLQYLR